MSPRSLLLSQTALAFSTRPDMSLLAALSGITDAESSFRPTPTAPTIEELVRHLAWSKSRFCHEAFSSPMPVDDPTVSSDGDTPNVPWDFPCGCAYARTTHPTITHAIQLLEQSHQIVLSQLNSLPEDRFDHPLPTRHGQSAAHFFSILLIHDLYHAGQIRTRRTLVQFRPE